MLTKFDTFMRMSLKSLGELTEHLSTRDEDFRSNYNATNTLPAFKSRLETSAYASYAYTAFLRPTLVRLIQLGGELSKSGN